MEFKDLLVINLNQIQPIENEFLQKIEKLVLQESLEEYATDLLFDEGLFQDAIDLGYLPTYHFVYDSIYVEDRLEIGLSGFTKMTEPPPKLPKPLAEIIYANSFKKVDLSVLPCLQCELGYAFNNLPILGCCPKYIKGKPSTIMRGQEECPFFKRLSLENE